MDPAEQIAATRAVREHSEDMLAVYHRHPDTPVHDVEEIGNPDTLLSIIALEINSALEMRAKRSEDNQTRKASLSATDRGSVRHVPVQSRNSSRSGVDMPGLWVVCCYKGHSHGQTIGGHYDNSNTIRASSV